MQLENQAALPLYLSLKDALTDCLQQEYWTPDCLPVFPFLASDESKVTVVYGDNVAGKSFFFKRLIAQLRLPPQARDRQEVFLASMSMRVSSEAHQTFMYPRETEMSTGANSLTAIKGCLLNGRNRTHPVWLFFDEPDVGLSDRFAKAMGSFLAQEINTLPDHIKGVCIVTHSRPLLLALREGLTGGIHQISMGQKRTLAEFVQQSKDDPASIEELLDLRSNAIATSRKIKALQWELKARTLA
ncbi:MAG: hypothetical protein Q7S87_09940 [Agitococcus sp.]|nr:hypothetical protein [Agitococcus sp.]